MNFETYPFEKLNELLKDIEPNKDLKSKKMVASKEGLHIEVIF